MPISEHTTEDETVYTVDLSYSDIELISYALYELANSTPYSERGSITDVSEKVSKMRTVDNVKTVHYKTNS